MTYFEKKIKATKSRTK